MRHNENNDWIEAMRRSLRDAELTPPDDGWQRLQRRLEAQASERTSAPAPQAAPRRHWQIVWPQVAAVAAVVLIGIVAGGILLRSDRSWVQGDIVASAAGTASTSASTPPSSEPEGLSQRLAEQVGWSEEPSDSPSSSIRQQRLLAAATPAVRPADEGMSRSVRAGGSEASAVSADAASIPTVDAFAAAERPADAAPANVGPAPQAAAANSRADDHADAVTRRAAARAAATPAGAATRSGYLSDPMVAVSAPRGRTTLSMHAGGGFSGSAMSSPNLPTLQMSASNAISESVGTGDKMVLTQRFDAEDNTYRHHQPLSFGVSVAQEFGHGLSLESGLIYTLVRSDVQTRYATEDVSQKLHFIGVPLRLNWRFLERERFSLYIGAGGMAEKCVSARFGATSVNEPAIQWSAQAAVGAQYRLGNTVGLYFEPECSYYFTETRLRTVRTEAPLTLSLRLGVRLSF